MDDGPSTAGTAAEITAKPFRFTIRRLFLITAVCAAVLTIPRVLRAVYYWDFRVVESRLQSRDTIENVDVQGHDDVTYEVHGASFHLKGRPDARVGLSVSSARSLKKDGHVFVRSIGPWGFVVEGHDYRGVTNTKTGKEVKSKFWGCTIDVGSKGRFAHLMPMEINNVDDLIANYDALVEFFETWPDESDPGVLFAEGDRWVHYYKKAKVEANE